MCKQISSNSFKNEITYKLFTYKSYTYPFNYANKWLIVNRIICVRLKYLKPFNCVQRISLGSFKNVINIKCFQIMYI